VGGDALELAGAVGLLDHDAGGVGSMYMSRPAQMRGSSWLRAGCWDRTNDALKGFVVRW
jgi:hypothetical protein